MAIETLPVQTKWGNTELANVQKTENCHGISSAAEMIAILYDRSFQKNNLSEKVKEAFEDIGYI